MPAIRGSNSKKKTRRRRRDLDQIHSDIHVAGHLEQHKKEKAEEDLPGLGEFYCTECAKWFDQEENLTKHLKSKIHRKRYVESKEFHQRNLLLNFNQSQSITGKTLHPEGSRGRCRAVDRQR